MARAQRPARGVHVDAARVRLSNPSSAAHSVLDLTMSFVGLRMSLQRQCVFGVWAGLLLGVCLIRPVAAQGPEPQVYNSRIEPHWIGETARFWYRRQGPGQTREFWLVDGRAGTRQPAFDHAAVAKTLSAQLKRDVTADRLPIDALEWSPDGSTVDLRGDGVAFRLLLSDGTLSPLPPPEPVSLPTDLPPRPSRQQGPETEIRFRNALKEEIELFWLETGGGRRSYGRVAPGAEHAQHTFAGHRWLVQTAGGRVVAVVEGRPEPGLALIDGQRPPRNDAPPDRRSGRRGDGGPPPTSVPSPDGRLEAVVRDHQLVFRVLADQSERLVTTDGSAAESYTRDAVRARAVEMNYNAPDWPASLPEVYWSPDSRFALAIRTRAVPEPKVTLVESTPRDQLQPKVHSYSYIKPGDPIPLRQVRLFDLSQPAPVPVADELFQQPWQIDQFEWRADSREVSFVYNQRGHQVLRLISLDPLTGQARAAIDETAQTFIDYSGKYHLTRFADQGEALWMSERDGWNHLYLCDTASGQVRQRVTQGEWVVRRVERVDAQARQVWFWASGVVAGQDPYYLHLGRVGFDGAGLAWLTAGDGTHTVQWSPDRNFLIDSWSRVDWPGQHVLRRADTGEQVCELEQADAREFAAAGIRWPTRFVAPGRDGQTPIHGILHWPTTPIPAGTRVPVIEQIYAGPHSSHVPKAFQPRYGSRDLTSRGFVVGQIDGMGTGDRSKAFHDVCWRNLADAGFADRIAWWRAAAQEFPELDLERVGIYGGSAGGQNALGAMLWHPEFYKVAVADCGCHDNRLDKIWWNEQWMGWPAGGHYVEQSNVTQAHRLQGALLLVVGELDRNVDPASTLQVADALVRADKDFDLLLIPGAGHGAAESPYGRRRRADFFTRHLLTK